VVALFGVDASMILMRESSKSVMGDAAGWLDL
jgi:hypothetical protein